MFEVIVDHAFRVQSILNLDKEQHWEGCSALLPCPRPLTRPATALLARLLPARPEDGPEKARRAADANSAALRRHFTELTGAFLEPFSSLFQLVGYGCGCDRLAGLLEPSQ
jgi:hypothetical protein